jgi:predicted XRE-type DNA-binding protein
MAEQNVFADLGFEDADELLAKSKLVMRISDRISKLGLTQKQAAQRLHVDQPTVSKLVRGRLGEFSTDRLIKFLNRLGNNVEIRVSKRPAKETGRTTVAV